MYYLCVQMHCVYREIDVDFVGLLLKRVQTVKSFDVVMGRINY